MTIKNRLGLLRDMRRKHLAQLRLNQSMPDKDKDGSTSDSLAGSLRFLGVADYVLDKDVAAFREQLSEAAMLRLKVFERFDGQEPVSPSYVSMLAYKPLLNAVAAGNEALAQSLAARMGGRQAIELEYDRPFDRAFGYCLKAIVLRNAMDARYAVQELDHACKEPENIDFSGYAKALHAIIEHDAGLLPLAFDEIVAGHKKQSVGAGLFKDTEDEVLCVWGVAIANLARWNGVSAPADGALLPAELISPGP
jgi:hypothetical protein